MQSTIGKGTSGCEGRKIDVAVITEEDLVRVYPLLAPRVAFKLMAQDGASHEEAVDAVNDVFADLLGRARRDKLPLGIGNGEHLRSYIARSAKNRLIDRHRKSVRMLAHESVIWSAAAPGDLEQELISAEQSALLWTAIEKLSQPYRKIFELLLTEELPLIDIAERIGSKKGSIYTQYARGLAKLRRLLRNQV